MAPDPPSAPKQFRQRHLARLLLAVASSALAIAALFVILEKQILPWAVRHAIVGRGAEATGMRVEVGRVEVSLARRELSIRDISLSSSTGGVLRSLRCKRLLAAVRPAGLARGWVVLSELSFEEPLLEVGAWDSEPARASSNRPLGGVTFGGRPLAIQRITVRDGRVHARMSDAREAVVHLPAASATDLELSGRGAETSWRLASLNVERSRLLVPRGEGDPLSISFSARASNATPDAAFPIEAELTRDDATLILSALAQSEEGRLDGSISASQVELAPLLARIDRRVPVTGGQVSGRLTFAAAREADGSYAVRLAPVPDQRTGRTIDVDDLELEILGASRHSVSSSEVSAVVEEVRILGLPGSPRIDARLGRVELAHPRIEIVRPRRAPSGRTRGSPPIRVAAKAVQIEDGFVSFLDETTAPPFDARWSHVNGDLEGFSWPRLRIDQLALEASGVGGDPVWVSGEVREEEAELLIEGSGDSLVRYSPHVAARTGLEVVGGTGALDSAVHIDGSGVQTKSELVLSRLGLKSKDPVLSTGRLAEMPLTLALALLTDTRGDITLHLDLAFGRGESGIDWLSLLAAGLQRSMARAATAPLRLIGAASLREEQAAAPVTWLGFVPGRASLSEESRGRVRNLAELLRERPELSVRLRGAVTEADLATPERRTDRDLDDEQWRADLESRRALAISSLLQDEYEISTGRVEVEAAEPAPHQRGPGVAVVLAGSPLVDTPEIPDLAQPDRDPSTPDVSAAPE